MSKTKTGVLRTVSRLNRMLFLFALPPAAYILMMGRSQPPSDDANLVNRAKQGDDDIQPCAEWAEKLALTRMEDLPSEEVDKLLKHLADCPACSATQLEYRMMGMLIRNYPPEKVVMYQPKRLPKPGFEFHRLRLLLQRQMKRQHGIALAIAALVIFLLSLGLLSGLLLHHQMGLSIPLIALAGFLTPMYPLWEGLHAIFASTRPVTFEEVKQHRSNMHQDYLPNEAKQRYEARVDNYLCVLIYEREGNNIYYLHTEVPPPIEGHGIAQKLTHTALEDAKAQNLTVYPLCSFVVSYIRRHPAYISLLPEKEQARWRRG